LGDLDGSGAAPAPGITRTRRTQRDRSETTTAELVAAARHQFAQDGYAATSLEAVAERAAVSKGAIYHHFRNKRDLFRAVYQAEQKAMSRLTAAAYLAEADPWDGLLAGCRRFLEISAHPDVARITLLDAPGALGWETMREIGESCRVQIRTGLTAVTAAGRVRIGSVEGLTVFLYGALCEAAMEVAHDPDPVAALARLLAELDAVFAALAAPAQS
jgi:AcrR family transcriptional regulator